MEKSTFTKEYQVFCHLLRQSREQSGITQVQLAKQLNETQSEISKFERGERRLDLVQLHQWCKATGVRLADFARSFEDAVSAKRK
jgi:transcriptional regulator with XRE-family HTH domain